MADNDDGEWVPDGGEWELDSDEDAEAAVPPTLQQTTGLARATSDTSNSDRSRPQRAKARGVSYKPRSNRVPFYEDEAVLEARLSQLRAARGGFTLSSQTLAVLLHLYTQLKLDYQKDKKKKGRNSKRPHFAKEVARLTGCSERVIKERYRACVMGEQQALAVVERGNHKAKPRRIPRTKALQFAIRRFLRNRRKKQQRVTSTQVLEELRRQKVIEVKQTQPGLDDEKDYRAALRLTQQWIKVVGFTRGIRDHVGLPDTTKLKLGHYIQAFMANRALPPGQQRREVRSCHACHPHTYTRAHSLSHTLPHSMPTHTPRTSFM